MGNPSSRSSGEPGQLVKETVSQGTQQATEAVSQMTDQAKQQAQSMLSRQKGQLTDTLSSVSSSLSQTGDSLRQQNQPTVAGVVDQAAGKVESVSRYLESHELNELVADVENFARRNTGLFLGGALALGVVAARFVKSSTPSTGTNSPSRGYYGGSQGYGYEGGQGYNTPGAYSQGTYRAEPRYGGSGAYEGTYDSGTSPTGAMDTFGEEFASSRSAGTFEGHLADPADADVIGSPAGRAGNRRRSDKSELNDGPAR